MTKELGKPRKPIALMLIEGKKHFSKAEIKQRQEQEVRGNTDKVRPPAYVPHELRGEFRRVAIELLRIGLICNTDVDCLAKYILSREQYVKATLKLRTLDPLDDLDEYTRLLNNQNKLFNQCSNVASELGLSISSRCRIMVPKVPKPEETEFNRKFGAV